MVRPQAEVRPTMTSAEGWNPRRARRLVLLGLLVLWLGWRAWGVLHATKTVESRSPNESSSSAEMQIGPPVAEDPNDADHHSALPSESSASAERRQGPSDRPVLAGNPEGSRAGDRSRLAPPGKSPGEPPRPGFEPNRSPRSVPPVPRPNPEPKASPGPDSTAESQLVRVRRVVDGDTLLLKDGTRVRMIGIDTPETKKEGTPVQPFGPEASEYTKKFCEGGTVRLVFDGERHDDYGRLLAHVYVGDQFLSEELIRNGLARVLYRHPYSDVMKDRFRAAENAAKRAKKGIWSLPPDKRRGAELPPGPAIDF